MKKLMLTSAIYIGDMDTNIQNPATCTHKRSTWGWGSNTWFGWDEVTWHT